MEREKGRGEEGRGDGRGRGTLDVVRWPRRVVVYLFTFVVHYSTNSKKKPEFKLEKRRNGKNRTGPKNLNIAPGAWLTSSRDVLGVG